MEHLTPPAGPTPGPENSNNRAAPPEAPLTDETRPPLAPAEFGRHSKPETLGQEIVSDSFYSMETRQAIEALRAYRKHGDAFAAYLTLEDTNTADPDIEMNFQDVYYGDQPLHTDIAEEYAHEQYWDSQYDAFMRTSDIPDDVLQLDYEKIGYILDAMFEVVEIDETRYLFHR